MSKNIARLQHLYLMHTLLSRVNRAIVRAESADDLFQEICKTAVESGLFGLAWIGLLDPKGSLYPVTSWGDTENIVELLAEANQLSSAPAAMSAVLQGGATFASQQITDLPFWRDESRPSSSSFAAMARIGLHQAGEVIGVLELYSTQADLLEDDVLALIEEVVGDVSFALDHLKHEEQRKVAESKMRYLAYYAPQTGMPSQTLLDQHLQQFAEQTTPLALLDIKLQRLEPILHVLGQSVVDEILRSLAHRLEQFCNAAFVAHLGQDEFVMVFPSIEDIHQQAQRIHELLSEVLSIAEHEVFLSASIGVALYPQDESHILHLLRRARSASKTLATDGGICFYRAELDSGLESRLILESELHRAFERNEFVLYYQPQVNLKTGVMVGVEALLRWQHPIQGLIQPLRFIPILEESGLIVAVGKWVLQTACAQNKAWQDAGLPPLRVAVNLSAQQFSLSELAQTVQEILTNSGLAAEWLELELTESIILANAERTITTMHALKKLGVSLSLDDFGTGYSSLSYLLRFPIDRIKIDRSFIQNVAKHAASGILARTILTMTHNLGKSSIAEGIEDVEQLGYLRKHGCHEMQGFFFSHPLPALELEKCLNDGKQLALPQDMTRAHTTVLVVDDEENVLHSLMRALRRNGLTILVATNAQEAFTMLATHEVGLIITDQRMPEMSGTELLSHVKELYPDIIRILLTGYTELNSVIDAINRGTLYKVLTKPWDDDQLRDNVNEALQRFETVQENRRLLLRLAALDAGNIASQHFDSET